ncbi:MAG TPA: hypothetical protein VJG83_01360 [archaeon]|nr:hypothetical protein [archaeon]
MKLNFLLAAGVLILLFALGCVNSAPQDAQQDILPTSANQTTNAGSGDNTKIAGKVGLTPFEGSFAPCTIQPFIGEKAAFSDEGVAYRFSYPIGWAWEIFLEQVSVYPTENQLPSISIGTDSLPGGVETTLENYDAYRINKRLKEDSGILELDETCSTAIFGATAHQIIYTDIPDAELVDEPDMHIKTLEIWAEKGGKIYLVSATARAKDFDGIIPGFNLIVSSLELN